MAKARWRVVRWIDREGEETELWADQVGLHLERSSDAPAVLIDYVEILGVAREGAQLRIRYGAEGAPEQSVLLGPAGEATEEQADELRLRIQELVDEHTEIVEDAADADAAAGAAGSTPLQFDRAEYDSGLIAGATCEVCRSAIESAYFQVNGKALCPTCKDTVERVLTSREGRGGRFWRALLFGTGAACVGTGLYYAVLALTGYEIGLVAIVVGLMVGAAVRLGCRGRGGAGYQLLAILLTYFSIVASYVPVALRSLEQSKASEQAPAKRTTGTETIPNRGGEGQAERELRKTIVTVFVVALALVMPFLGPFVSGWGGVMGLLIVGFALYEAWRLNKRPPLSISGPFQIAKPSPDGVSG